MCEKCEKGVLGEMGIKENRELLEEELCYNDPYTKNFLEMNSYLDEEELREEREEWDNREDKRCSCDNCFYGRDTIARIALKYLEIVEKHEKVDFMA